MVFLIIYPYSSLIMCIKQS